ncbi:MAG: hypothetical protein II258_08630 [Spirochaetales bacterium]|nr:hypothetical protein [Spirochaetales bacterium]
MEKSLEERIKKILAQCTPEETKKLQSKVEARKSSDEPFVKEYKNILKKRRDIVSRNEDNYHKNEDLSATDERAAQAMLWQNLVSEENVNSEVLGEVRDYVKSLISKMKNAILASVEMELYIINSVLDLFQKQGYSENTLEQIEQITVEELEKLKSSKGK